MEKGMIQVCGKKGAEMTSARRVQELQTFSPLCFAEVQLMRPASWIFSVLPRSSSVSVQQVTHTTSHSSGLFLPTTPAFQGGTLGAPRSVEPCVSQLPASQAGEWSLVAEEKTAANEISPVTAEFNKQLLLHLHSSPTQVSSWLSHSWTSCSTLHRHESRFSVEGIWKGPMLSLFAVALGCLVCSSAAADSFPHTWQ